MKTILKLLGIALFISIVFFFIGSIYQIDSHVYYESDGTVTERRSGKSVVITLDDQKKTNTLLMHTNILLEGDRVNVKFKKKKREYIVDEVTILLTENQKELFAERIMKDPSMIRYSERIKVGEEILPVIAHPEVIKGEKINSITKEELYDYYQTESIITPNKKHEFSFAEKIAVLEFNNINGNKSEEVKYEYNYKYDRDKIIFTSLNGGVYHLKLLLSDDSIITYIFT